MLIFLMYSLCLILLILSIHKKHYIIMKTVMSLSFVGIAIYSALSHQQTHLLTILLPGLIACLAGDFVLATHHPKHFVYGLGCFFVAHVCFVMFFMNFQALSLIELIIACIAIVIVISLSYLSKMDYRHYQTAIVLYTFILTLSLIMSISVYIHLGTSMFLCCMIGFILFYISDIVLLFERFYQTRYQYQLKIINLIFYYYGLFMIAYSLACKVI